MLKPYDGYKKVNEVWVDNTPKHWEFKRIKHTFYNRVEKNSPVKTECVLSLSAKNGVELQTEKTDKGGNKPKSDFSKYNVAHEQDLLVNCMNVVSGSSGVSNWYGAISPVYYALHARNGNTNIRYYHYLFRFKPFYRSLLRFSKGILMHESDNGNLNTVRMRISMESLNNINIPIPPRIEQDQIVKYLDWQTSKINTLIKAKKKQIELLKEQKQAVINKAVTKGLDDTVPMKDSGIEWLGEVPEHWTIRNLGSFASLQNGISESGDFFTQGFPFVNYGDVYNNYALPKEVDGLANSNKKQQEVYSIIEGDILFTRTSETKEDIARSCVAICTIENAVFSGFVIRVRPISNTILTGYSKFYFRNELLRNYFVKEMNIVTRASLSQGVLRNLPVMLPSLDEQQAIVTYLEEKTALIENAIAVIEKEIELVSEYKTSLISSVVTGKVDVRDVVVPDFEVIEEVSTDIENVEDEMEE